MHIVILQCIGVYYVHTHLERDRQTCTYRTTVCTYMDRPPWWLFRFSGEFVPCSVCARPSQPYRYYITFGT
jgi:hypothetical protein